MTSLELVITGKRQIEALSIQRPPVPRDHVLVRTTRTLVSPGTELSFFEGTHIGFGDPKNGWVKYPFRPGYAAIGEVVEIGESSGVQEMPRLGSRVFFFGAHSHWNLLDVAKVWIEVPADLSDEAVLLTRLMQISATGVDVLRRPPQCAVVVGAGLIGQFAAQVLKLRGCPMVVIQDVVASRLELARRNGLENAVEASGMGLDAVITLLGGTKPDCVIEATGIPGMVAPCLEAVATDGDVVLLGIPRGVCTLDLYALLVRKSAALLGAHEARIPDRTSNGGVSRQGLVEEMIRGLRAGSLRVEGIVTASAEPTACQTLYDQLSGDKERWLTAAIDWT